MTNFCAEYPASSSAKAVLHNAEIGQDKGLISKNEYAKIKKIMDDADPKAKEMNKIRPALEKAMASNDIKSLNTIATQLKEIADSVRPISSAID